MTWFILVEYYSASLRVNIDDAGLNTHNDKLSACLRAKLHSDSKAVRFCCVNADAHGFSRLLSEKPVAQKLRVSSSLGVRQIILKTYGTEAFGEIT
jgi:hypothetical protein